MSADGKSKGADNNGKSWAETAGTGNRDNIKTKAGYSNQVQNKRIYKTVKFSTMFASSLGYCLQSSIRVNKAKQQIRNIVTCKRSQLLYNAEKLISRRFCVNFVQQTQDLCQNGSLPNYEYQTNIKQVQETTSTSWLDVLQQFSLRAMVSAVLVVLVIFGGANSASAARSGGRVGGGSFSSFKAPAASSYSPSYSSPSSSHHTTIITSPGVGFGMPSFFFPAFGFGYGYAPVGSGFINILILAFVAFVIVQAVQTFTSSDEDGAYESVGGPASVIKLQVGLLGSARQLQQDLERMARQADTSSSQGLHFVLQEIVLSLMRNPAYWVYGSSSLRKVKNVDDAENAYNNMQLEERGKFKEETLVNVSGIKKNATSGSSSKSNDLIVVTILVAADGKLEIPQVRNAEDLRQALTILGGVRQEQLMATEILWTPADENDYYTKDEIFMDYPTLVPL
eukprot:TRINITY_DN6049_c0_g3_i1.p1 TRINITY_DN6049_c0_g3~~TRINITY_DN6049_c0_g3_i1.p1  ORF type:complete len:452 (-),score=43.84 TRINITY_DN6049_c0_g3_i1:207-1562(-)